MRTIESEMLRAIKNKQMWRKSNTTVRANGTDDTGEILISKVYLFDNHIGDYHHETGNFETNIQTLLDWPSVTTMSRLRALGVNVTQKKWVVYIDGQPIGNKLKYDYTDGTYK